MVNNNIKAMLASRKMTAAELASRLPDENNSVVMSMIASGKTMPTKRVLDKMCEVLNCSPTDLYATSDLHLEGDAESSGYDHSWSSQSDGREQIRVWMPPVERESLERAVEGLGYRSIAEWFREMQRNTVQKYAALNLAGKSIHSSD